MPRITGDSRPEYTGTNYGRLYHNTAGHLTGAYYTLVDIAEITPVTDSAGWQLVLDWRRNLDGSSNHKVLKLPRLGLLLKEKNTDKAKIHPMFCPKA